MDWPTARRSHYIVHNLDFETVFFFLLDTEQWVHTRCGGKVMRLATLCTNRQRCCHPLHMAVRLTPAVDSIQVWTCCNCYKIVESIWSEVKVWAMLCHQILCELGESATVAYEKLQRANGKHSLQGTSVQMAQVLLRMPRTRGRRNSCGKTFNLRNGRQCGKSEVSSEVRSLIDVENYQ
jgi:hypothetical protein